jgi:hypothetical protein
MFHLCLRLFVVIMVAGLAAGFIGITTGRTKLTAVGFVSFGAGLLLTVGLLALQFLFFIPGD